MKPNSGIDSVASLDNLTDGETLSQTGILFPKIERAEKESLKEEAPKPKNASKSEPAGSEIEIGDFLKSDLRVAKVLSAERVEGSDKLLKLRVSTGDGTRQIVAGVGMKYSPEEMTGKKIVIVANLKPAEIFKQRSEGMLLAAKKDKKDMPSVIFVDDSVPEGSKLG
jgi:methionyl-tRNA synthetase